MVEDKGETGMACFGKESKAANDIWDAMGHITAPEATAISSYGCGKSALSD